jgi:CxxC motif-containing protein
MAVTESDDHSVSVEGNTCPKGLEFAEKEVKDPERILTTSIRVIEGDLPLVSVRSDAQVKKHEILTIVNELKNIYVKAPIKEGQLLEKQCGVNRVNIIATRTVYRRI